jgi:hypothetical protein
MFERQRQKLIYRNVLRGQDRLRMAARVFELRGEGLLFREIGEQLGISTYKANVLYHHTDCNLFKEYLKEKNDE